ncbi:TRAP transporter large permease subunit [Hankyongella ginsenosidimutans]|uniref:TRAP transporter large permease subunit n=1 Tax=Hankyongella ginsenosidimutans TaxID=1763828 RepID=UPI001CA33AE1|nr:TRAP transporter large permease subunit [Hankyongella ginsenosidimutans]
MITAIIFTILLGTSLFLTVFQSFGGLTILGRARRHAGRPAQRAPDDAGVDHRPRALPRLRTAALSCRAVGRASPAAAGAEPLALGVAIALVVQMGLIMPPNGLALAYLRQAAPGMPAASIWKGIAPYFGIQLVVLLLVLLIAPLTQWLPAAMNQ